MGIMYLLRRKEFAGLALRPTRHTASFLTRGIILVSSILLVSASFGQVPKSAGRTLAGNDVSLPDLFQQQPVVLVIGFSQKSSDDAKTWSRTLIQSEKEEGRNDVYGVILLSGVPHLLRGLVVRSIRKDVSESVQSRFVTVTDSEQEWRDFASVTSPDDVYILVLGASGEVCWRGHGPYSDPMLAAVKRSLQQARANLPSISGRSKPAQSASTKAGSGSAGGND